MAFLIFVGRAYTLAVLFSVGGDDDSDATCLFIGIYFNIATVDSCWHRHCLQGGSRKTIYKPTTSNYMKNLVKLAAVVAAVAMSQAVQATAIVGNIGFTGSVVFNTSSPGTAASVSQWNNPYVTSDSGAFGSIPIGPLSPVTMAAGSWSFASGPVNNFWSVAGFTFNLLSSSVFSQGGTPGVNGFVFVTGIGTVTSTTPGLDPTQMTWSFTSQDPPAGVGANGGPNWTFSASANSVNVPDGGATVMLLGLALSGVAVLRRKLTK